MERRLNKRAEVYVTTFKDDIREKAVQLGLGTDTQTNTLLQYIYDYDRFILTKDSTMSACQVIIYLCIIYKTHPPLTLKS